MRVAQAVPARVSLSPAAVPPIVPLEVNGIVSPQSVNVPDRDIFPLNVAVTLVPKNERTALPEKSPLPDRVASPYAGRVSKRRIARL